MKEKIISSLMSLTLAVSCFVPAYAGTWEKKTHNDNSVTWKYKQDNGTYFCNDWKQINGDWYHFSGPIMEADRAIYTENNGFHVYGAPVYYVGSDGKWITQGGFYKESNGNLIFIDSTGKIVPGFFMVDDVLYYVNFSNTDGYTISSIIPTYRAKRSAKLISKDGKEYTLNYIYDGGKVLDLDGTPISESDPEDDNFFSTIKYLPKYNSQGQLVGAIQNSNSSGAENNKQTNSARNKIIGKWYGLYMNSNTAGIITSSTIAGVPYTVIEDKGDSIIIETNENGYKERHMYTNFTGSTMTGYLYNPVTGSYTGGSTLTKAN